MQEINCPHCGHSIVLDDASYAVVLSQVRDAAFEKEVAQKAADIAAKSKAERENLRLTLQQEHEKTLAELTQRIAKMSADKDFELMTVKSECDALLHAKDAEIAFYKDFKAKQSTKMTGESLERHCEDEFNKVRAMAFPGAYFEKDNEVSQSGSKGDYIFREMAGETELLSIMFEMKNETESDSKKHRNEEFFKELDKDRREKGCEYAVLVTMLEPDSELYNQGIVDVSHRYPKMYVIRPQFFIPVISFLRNSALSTLSLRQELAVARAQDADFVTFTERLSEFKDKFGRNYRIASERYSEAIEGIDKTIAQLEKVKKALLSSENNLRLAGDKAEGLTVEKLAKGLGTEIRSKLNV